MQCQLSSTILFVIIAVLAFTSVQADGYGYGDAHGHANVRNGAGNLGNPNDVHAEIRSFENDLKDDGHYSFKFDTTNGISQQESGVGGHYVTGSSQYYSPEGQLIQLTYTADENGFHPQGAHLPTPPPIPAAILKSLEYIRAHPHQNEDGGHYDAAPSNQYIPPAGPSNQYLAPQRKY